MATNKQTHSTTLIQRLDPRVKFLGSILLTIQAFSFDGTIPLILLLAILVPGVVLARIPILNMIHRLSSILVFFLVILGVNLFTVSGAVLFEFLGMFATREGLQQGLILSARLALVLIVATVFARTTSIPSIVDGIESTFRPVHKRLGAVVQVLAIALNFIPMLIQSARQIKKAQIARGAEPDRNLVRQLQFAFSATVPLFAMTLRSSEHLAQAMESRCYDPLADRTLYSHLRMNFHDWLIVMLITAQSILFFVIQSATITPFA